MTKFLFISAISAMLLLSGCSKKSPAVDESASQATESEKIVNEEPVEVQTDVETEVVPEDSMVVNDTTDDDSSKDVELTMTDIEKKFSSVNFEFDRFNIRASENEKVTTAVSIINKDAEKYSVKLEGNCDEWGSDEYNYALGLRRANSVKKEMLNKGVEATRIVMVSYGESNPVCQDKSSECWAKNRRVDFKLLP